MKYRVSGLCPSLRTTEKLLEERKELAWAEKETNVELNAVKHMVRGVERELAKRNVEEGEDDSNTD